MYTVVFMKDGTFQVYASGALQQVHVASSVMQDLAIRALHGNPHE
jgi:hypothetical protein